MRGTFANVRIRNQIAPGTEGGYTTFFPTGEVQSVYDALTGAVSASGGARHDVKSPSPP